MERYFVNIETMEITDSISESLMQTVIYNARILLNEPGNYNARAEIMWAGSLSHNGLTGCGTGGGDWACHQDVYKRQLMCRSSCFLPKAKPSIKYLVLNWGQMTILSNRLIPKNWLPVCCLLYTSIRKTIK